MEGLSDEESISRDEESIPTEPERSNATTATTTTTATAGRSMSGTLHRKVAKRTFPWLPAAAEPLASPMPIDGDIPVAKKPRLEVPLLASPTTVDPSTADAMVAPPDAENNDANEDPVTDTHDVLDCSTDRAIGRKNSWTTDEDLKLKYSVQMHGGNNWAAISSLVPGRTAKQCRVRWHNVLHNSNDQSAGRWGLWTEHEDINLRHAVQMHGEDWFAIAALVPGRTTSQCHSRWYKALDHSIDRTPGRTGARSEDEDRKRKWTEDEDTKLKDSIQMHGGETWAAIAALVPGRTKIQCSSRWHNTLQHSNNPAPGRWGIWTEDEDSKLMDAVQMHSGKDSKNWFAIAALVPGRTKKQCSSRWRYALDPGINQAPNENRMPMRNGFWTPKENGTLLDAVQMYGGKNWDAITALVPGRTKMQCSNRYHVFLNHGIDRVPVRSGKWTADEDDTLKTAVERHCGKKHKWETIAALLPGRTRRQCWSRWRTILDTISDVDRAISTNIASPDAEGAARLPTDADPMTATPPNASAAGAPSSESTLENAVELTIRVVKPTIEMIKHKSGKEIQKEELASVAAMTLTQPTNIHWRTSNGESAWCSSISADQGSIDRETIRKRKGLWSADEDKALRDAAEEYIGMKMWGPIASLIPDRTANQCKNRWHLVSDPSIESAAARWKRWTVDEDNKLKDAEQTHGGQNWDLIAAMVPGRSKFQCWNRWKYAHDARSNRTKTAS
jgi:hypothetical protein